MLPEFRNPEPEQLGLLIFVILFIISIAIGLYTGELEFRF